MSAAQEVTVYIMCATSKSIRRTGSGVCAVIKQLRLDRAHFFAMPGSAGVHE